MKNDYSITEIIMMSIFGLLLLFPLIVISASTLMLITLLSLTVFFGVH